MTEDISKLLAVLTLSEILELCGLSEEEVLTLLRDQGYLVLPSNLETIALSDLDFNDVIYDPFNEDN